MQLDLLDGFADDYDDDWWFPGQYGFALGERGHYEKAVAAAERSLELSPGNFWAAHTLAHVYADTKDDGKGAEFLGPWLSRFDSRAPMFGHTSWHLTLFELGCGHHRRAMEIYDTGVRPAVCKHRSTLNNSASFLWRCMVYGYEPTTEQWDEVISTDLSSMFYCTSAVVAGMRERNFGRIINMSSIIGQMGNVGQANYAAAKAGMIAFTKSAAKELARNSITVNAVCPGFVETEMVAALDEEIQKTLIANIPLGRFGTAEEVAQTVRFLCTEGDFYTGAEMSLNGGQYM